MNNQTDRIYTDEEAIEVLETIVLALNLKKSGYFQNRASWRLVSRQPKVSKNPSVSPPKPRKPCMPRKTIARYGR
jgi:hypothetical protein